jgi:hydroxypyruvate reductase
MFQAERFLTHTLRSHLEGMTVCRILADTFNIVEPGAVVKKYLREHPLPLAKRVFGFGLGKAAVAMTRALADETALTDTLVITKHASPLDFEPVTVIEGNHPIPGRDSLRAGSAAMDFLAQLTKDDLLVCLISGGGSALMTAPLIPLDDLQALTSALLASGARIEEINTLRRHLDELKGGGVAQRANGAQIISLILSDVVGDALEAIASGPTAPDSTARDDVLSIIEEYGLEGKIPASVISNLRETAKPDDPVFTRVKNMVIAGNKAALDFARSQFWEDGFPARVVEDELQGEARDVGRVLAGKLKKELEKTSRPFCLLAGGETTVTIQGGGKGGRNQELALAAVDELAGLENVMLISIATDGEDGPTDAAGAVVTGETAQRARMLGMDAAGFLSRNDAYSYFAKLDDLIKTGPSGTNVNDLVLCLAF